MIRPVKFVIGAVALTVFWFIADLTFKPTRSIELHALAYLQDIGYSRGGGYDEWTPMFLTSHSSRYAPTIIRLLDRSEPGTLGESTALATVESALAEPGVRRSLVAFGCSHDDPDTVSLVADMLADPASDSAALPTGSVVLPSSSEMIALRIFPRKQIGTLEEERARIGCDSGNDS